MKLTKADVGKRFNTNLSGDDKVTIVYKTGLFEELFVVEHDDKSGVYTVDSSGICDDGSHFGRLVSRHDPRSWLADMPNLGDIKEGWIAADSDGRFRIHKVEPINHGTEWIGGIGEFDCVHRAMLISWPNMPTLTGDQWKDSLTSVAELKQWQASNS